MSKYYFTAFSQRKCTLLCAPTVPPSPPGRKISRGRQNGGVAVAPYQLCLSPTKNQGVVLFLHNPHTGWRPERREGRRRTYIWHKLCRWGLLSNVAMSRWPCVPLAFLCLWYGCYFSCSSVKKNGAWPAWKRALLIQFSSYRQKMWQR